MISSKFTPVPLTIRRKNIQRLAIRGYKHVQSIQDHLYDSTKLSSPLIIKFLKFIKKAKILRVVDLQNKTLKPFLNKMHMLFESLKIQGKNIWKFSISPQDVFSCRMYGRLITSMLKIKEILHDHSHCSISKLQSASRLENLLIRLEPDKVDCSRFCEVLNSCNRLKNIRFIYQTDLTGPMLSLLDKLTTYLRRSIRLQLKAVDDSGYSSFPIINPEAWSSLTQIDFDKIDEVAIFQGLLVSVRSSLVNLRSLKLSLATPDLHFTPYLTHLESISQLEKLRLTFDECWVNDFFEGVVKHLRLPKHLKRFSMSLGLSFSSVKESNQSTNITKYSWRENNVFETDEHFAPFLKALEDVEGLEKLRLKLQLLENFKSFHSGFFTAVMSRVPNVTSLMLHLSDCPLNQSVQTEEEIRGFDLLIFFNTCLKLNMLKWIDIIMPEMLFDDLRLDASLHQLNDLSIGVSSSFLGASKQYKGISGCLRQFLKVLHKTSPNLKSLIFDFLEVFDNESALLRRFLQIQKFKRLNILCVNAVVNKCSPETVKQVGGVIQFLRSLETLMLKFVESDDNLHTIEKYRTYSKSLQYSYVGVNEELEFE